MASSIAAAPIFVDHQEQESSSSTNSTSITIPANHHHANLQRLRKIQKENKKSLGRCVAWLGAVVISYCLNNKISKKFSIIFYMDFEEFSSYYKIEAFVILILCGFLYYAAYVPRKLYIMKNVSNIFGILFIMDLVMIAIMVNNKCFSTNENGFGKPQLECFGFKSTIIFPIYSSISMCLSSINTLLTYGLIMHQTMVEQLHAV